MSNMDFFDEQSEQSLVKTTIVTKYFDAWANVIASTQDKQNRGNKKIAYIDLFAGPGRYKDGTVSTPVIILKKAIAEPKYRDKLVCIFNDNDENKTNSLRSVINAISDVDKLTYEPKVYTQNVGTDIVKMFDEMTLIPTLFFVDPWGYKGLSLKLINSVLKDWGCECIFFFNYNRINMGLGNKCVKEHMDCLFDEERADGIREKFSTSTHTPNERECMIIEELCAALKEMGGKYTLPFRFKDKNGKRTSHHLIFVSKKFKGYEIMKNIMAKESSSHDEGIASFEYTPADQCNTQQGLLFKLSRPLSDLSDMLLKDFAREKMTMRNIYEKHSVDTPYISKNYKDALLQLEKEGKIKAIRGPKQLKDRFAESVIAIFS